jgi:hypothetical protein
MDQPTRERIAAAYTKATEMHKQAHELRGEAQKLVVRAAILDRDADELLGDAVREAESEELAQWAKKGAA